LGERHRQPPRSRATAGALDQAGELVEELGVVDAHRVTGLPCVDGFDHDAVDELPEREEPREDLGRLVVVGLDAAHELRVARAERRDERLVRVGEAPPHGALKEL